MAEELGATVHTWRNDTELKLLLAARGISPCVDGITRKTPDAGERNAAGPRNTVVLLDEEEVRDAGGSIVVHILSLKEKPGDICAANVAN